MPVRIASIGHIKQFNLLLGIISGNLQLYDCEQVVRIR